MSPEETAKQIIGYKGIDCQQSKLVIPDDVSPLGSASTRAKLKLGLFSYPVLQAADILLYGYGAD